MVALAEQPQVNPPKVNPLDRLRALAAKAPASKKAETPVADAQELGDTIKAFLEAKKQMEFHESLMETFGAQIRSLGRDHWIAAGRKANKVVSSVKLQAVIDGKPETVTYTQQCRYCKLPNETPEQQQRLTELQATFPNDHERYFANVIDVSLSEGAASDPEFLGGYVELLMNHYGEAGFAEKFTVKSTYTPTKDFHEAYVLKPEVRQAAEPFVQEDTIRAYKASVKV